MRHSQVINPLIIKCPTKGNILILSPHPDDEIIGAGGTLIAAVKKNKSKVHCIFFSSYNRNKKLIENEIKKVSKFVNFTYTCLKYFPDNFKIEDSTLKKIAEKINNLKPKKVFLPFLFDDHDDHRRVNEIILKIIEKNYINKLNFEIWGYQGYSTFPCNVIVDISENFNKKILALKKYKSQIEKKNLPHFALGLAAFNSRFINSKDRCYGESFFVLPIKDYVNLCKNYFKYPASCYYNKNYL